MRLLLLLCFVNYGICYQKYTSPLQLATPAASGVYEFDLVVQKKLSMAWYSNSKHEATPVDYDPSTQTWNNRDVHQANPCFDTTPINSNKSLEDVLSLDGRHVRVITINGRSPAEPIAVPLGSEVLFRVTNNVFLDSISIHVHGLDKKDLWFTDGVPFLQQCPIPSSTYYEYRFIADRKGTHWLHGHLHTDRGDGLLGAFIVIDPKDGMSDREYAIVLQDWGVQLAETSWYQFKEKTMKWMYGFENNTQCWAPKRMSDGGGLGGSVPLSAILFNEKGWYNQEDILTHPQHLPLERLQIKQNETIRLRLINGGTSQELMFHVQGHQMTVVAADGDDVSPFKTDRLIIFPGERYDVIIKGLSTASKKSYIIQAETVSFFNWDWTADNIVYGVAFFEYEDATLREDSSIPNYLPTECTVDKKCVVLNCPSEYSPKNFNYTCLSYDTLKNLHPESIDQEILQATTFNSGYEEHFINMHYDSRVDGFRFQFPKGLPYYYQDNLDAITNPCVDMGCNNENHDERFSPNCSCFYNKKHKLNNIVQVTLYNMGTGGAVGTGYAHPFHMHGTHFYVMKTGWPSYNTSSGLVEEMNPDIACVNSTTVCNAAAWSNSSWFNGAVEGMNTVNPTSRDTITLPVGGYITIRFRATNPGYWLAHCHLVLHQMEGMAYAFQVGEMSDFMPPPANFPSSCGPYVMSKLPTKSSTTSVFDGETTTPSGLSPINVFTVIILSILRYI